MATSALVFCKRPALPILKKQSETLRLHQKMMTSMRKKSLLGFLILFGVLLLGFGGYLLTRKPAALSINSNPTSAPNEGPRAAALTADTGKAEIYRPGGESPNERVATESSADAEASQDFSGVTTIDPALSSTAPTPQKTPERKKESTAPLPLVFQPVDPHAFKITPEQQEILDRLQQNFLDQIGGANRDPNDPQYLARWKEARPLIDEQLKAQLGQDFFQRYQLAVAQRAAKQQ
jgi:hypothetical protein